MENLIAIVGGGASGLMSAIFAMQKAYSIGKKINIVILEKNDRVGKKILATGNGRCNLTNINAQPSNYNSDDMDFVASVLKHFTPCDTLEFFSKLGLLCRTEKDGKVYPYANQAGAVLDLLRLECKKYGVIERCNFEVCDIICKKDRFLLIDSNNEQLFCNSVILSTGGRASERNESINSGYNLAKKLGHSVTKLFPTLVQVKVSNKIVKSMSGIKIDATVSAMCGEKILRKEFGEVLFTDYGLSGPPIFQLARTVNEHKNVRFVLDIMSDYEKDFVLNILMQRKIDFKDRQLEDFLTGIINKRIGQTILRSIGLSLLEKVNILTDNNIQQIAKILKGWEFNITDTMSWQNAQVTAGGIPTSEVDITSLQSKKCKNLYITGELLNVDGDCGGYNLQWAWATGYIVGTSI